MGLGRIGPAGIREIPRISTRIGPIEGLPQAGNVSEGRISN